MQQLLRYLLDTAFLFSLCNVSPFFFLFNVIALLFLVQLCCSSILARRYYFSFLGQCCDYCVLYSTLLFLCSLLIPSVACSHLGTSLLCCDVVVPMVLTFCVCSSCFKLVLFPIGFRFGRNYPNSTSSG
jgi:hypothetical protein